MTDLVNEHKVRNAARSQPAVQPLSRTGRVAFAVMGDWMIPLLLRDRGSSSGTSSRLPAHPVTGKNTIDAYQNGISITSSAPHPD